MRSHSWNKLTTISCALAAAGVLTCAAALLDLFMPRASLAGFVASMILLGFVVTGIVLGYAWVCDKCEDYFNRRLNRRFDGEKPNGSAAANAGSAAGPIPAEPKVARDLRPASDTRQPCIFHGRHIPTPRGADSPGGAAKATTARTWHEH